MTTDSIEEMERPPGDHSGGNQLSHSTGLNGTSGNAVPTSSSASAQLAVATARNTNAKHWQQSALSWAEVCEAVRHPSDHKECGNWFFGTLRGTTRTNETVVSRSALTIDVDHPDAGFLDDLLMVANFAFVAHSTYSSAPEQPRYRLIVPTDREMTPQEYECASQAFAARYGDPKQFDKVSFKPSQYMYRPSHNPASGHDYTSVVEEGQALSVDALLSEAQTAGLVLSGPLLPSPESATDTFDVSTPPTEQEREKAEAILAMVVRQIAEDPDLKGGRNASVTSWMPLLYSFVKGGVFDRDRVDDALWEASQRAPGDGPYTRDEFNHSAGSGWEKAVAQRPDVDRPEDVFEPLPDLEDDGRPHPVEYSSPNQPVVVAREILRNLWTIADHEGVYTLAGWRGGWMEWRTTHWAEIAEEDLFSRVTKHLEHAFFMTKKGAVRWNPTKGSVTNLLSSMGALSRIPSETDTPAWLHPRPYTGTLVSCRNGLLDVDTRDLTPHDPTFFNTVSVPFDYDPDAPEPVRWLAFLESVWPDDADAQATLQQWFGYVLSGRTDLQKMFALIGPRRSGKGTIARTLTSLVGAGNVAGPSLHSLGTNFGLAPLLGKSLAIVGDARLGTGDGAKAALANILGISGEDHMMVDRKYRDPWNGRLPVRLMFMSNELPSFYDSSGAISSRFLLLPMTKSFYGQEDPKLGVNLLPELPSILNWALDGLADLNRRGTFAEPTSAEDMRSEFDGLVSPINLFIEERCELGPEFWAPTQELYDTWTHWCFDTGHGPGGSREQFAKNLRAALPTIKTMRRGPRGRQTAGYSGIHLRFTPFSGINRELNDLVDEGVSSL